MTTINTSDFTRVTYHGEAIGYTNGSSLDAERIVSDHAEANGLEIVAANYSQGIKGYSIHANPNYQNQEGK